MPPPRDSTLCQSSRGRTARCRQPYAAHVGPELACPDGSGRVWRVCRSATRAGQSFAEPEVRALALVCRALLRGQLRGDQAAAFARQHAAALGTLAGKASRMLAQIERQQVRAADKPPRTTDPLCQRQAGKVACRRRLSEHVEHDGAGGVLCPDGSGRTYLPYAPRTKRERAVEHERIEREHEAAE